jgi:hypothetical protein
MMSLNMRAVVELSHLFLPSMTAKGDWASSNVGSTAFAAEAVEGFL